MKRSKEAKKQGSKKLIIISPFLLPRFFASLTKAVININKKGFTFVEVMVSIAILSTGIVAVVQSFTTTLKSINASEKILTAVSAIENKLEEIEEQNRIDNSYPEGGANGNIESASGYKWSSSVSKVADSERAMDLKLTVSWEEGMRGEGNISFDSYLLNLNKEEEKVE